MRFVMVPVPREHVLDVMRWVLFNAPDEGETVARDNARVVTLLSELDDVTRTMLQRIASASVKDEPLRLDHLAADLDIETSTLSDMIRRLNRETFGAGREFVKIRSDAAVGVHGKTGKLAYLVMRAEHAHMVRSAAAAAATGE